MRRESKAPTLWPNYGYPEVLLMFETIAGPSVVLRMTGILIFAFGGRQT